MPAARPRLVALALASGCAYGGAPEDGPREIELHRVEIESRDGVTVMVGLDRDDEPVSESSLFADGTAGVMRIEYDADVLTVAISPMTGSLQLSYLRDVWRYDWSTASTTPIPPELVAGWNPVAGAWQEVLMRGDLLADGVAPAINLREFEPIPEAADPQWPYVCGTVVGWQCAGLQPSVALACRVAGQVFCEGVVP
ncbi:MAG: hypothetical protein K1X88_30410 [Nannocystaceae bacterium]|nr:hypothetical protein [Nannocystaceae bacterium]